MDWCLPSELSQIPLIAGVMSIILFVAFSSAAGSFEDTQNKRILKEFVLQIVLPSLILGMSIFFGIYLFSVIWQNKALNNASTIKVEQAEKKENPDHSSYRYIYHVTDSKDNIYEIGTNKNIDFNKYTVKIPYDSVYGHYIYLAKDNKYIASCPIIGKPYKK